MKRIVPLTILGAAAFLSSSAQAQEQFKDFEIRVIKNKSFQKRGRLELGAQTSLIMNKSFVYTPMIGAKGAFHFTETLGIFGEGAYAHTLKNGDCEVLGKDFHINPIIEDITWAAGAGVSYTPIYGKFQMSNGEVLYFDTYFTAGGGVAGYRKDDGMCFLSNRTAGADGQLKEPLQATSMQINFGIGQKYFTGKNLSINWDLRVMTVDRPADEDGTKNGNIITNGLGNIFLSLGIGYFL